MRKAYFRTGNYLLHHQLVEGEEGEFFEVKKILLEIPKEKHGEILREVFGGQYPFSAETEMEGSVEFIFPEQDEKIRKIVSKSTPTPQRTEGKLSSYPGFRDDVMEEGEEQARKNWA